MKCCHWARVYRTFDPLRSPHALPSSDYASLPAAFQTTKALVPTLYATTMQSTKFLLVLLYSAMSIVTVQADDEDYCHWTSCDQGIQLYECCDRIGRNCVSLSARTC
ncbi:hypothetical protein CERZMDRAFT_115843 [Cercospora zeae-maydis SCOH1-5]|uniref:Uncharacterized protein n=1 Tax=Cercospora zeae-maydis SCOH1-5 TaxID=717836 RepID=A0A6A6F1R2_9PEZI|nr:hypothetical protein CERZMDRAFT_115843 [Cercospora zeae-maydis SCOH1-5]